MRWNAPFAACALLAAVGLAAFAADSAEREKSGKARLTKDLAEARRLGRPVWLRTTPLEAPVPGSTQTQQSAVSSRVNEGKMREAMRILYAVVDAGDARGKWWAGMHLPQKLAQTREFAFAIVEFGKRSPQTPQTLRDTARCYLAYDQYATALDYVRRSEAAASGSKDKDFDLAKGRMATADILRRKGDLANAKESYEKAREIYRTGAATGGAPMQRFAAVMQEMSAFCDGLADFDAAKLKPGTYQGRGSGYSGPITVSVTVADGRITEVKIVQAAESVPFNALADVPRWIVESNTPSVDAVTGATLSSHGVMAAAGDALRKAR